MINEKRYQNISIEREFPRLSQLSM